MAFDSDWLDFRQVPAICCFVAPRIRCVSVLRISRSIAVKHVFTRSGPLPHSEASSRKCEEFGDYW
jgi:hypothetical protein